MGGRKQERKYKNILFCRVIELVLSCTAEALLHSWIFPQALHDRSQFCRHFSFICSACQWQELPCIILSTEQKCPCKIPFAEGNQLKCWVRLVIVNYHQLQKTGQSQNWIIKVMTVRHNARCPVHLHLNYGHKQKVLIINSVTIPRQSMHTAYL